MEHERRPCRGIFHLLRWTHRPLFPRCKAIAKIWEGLWSFCRAQMHRLAHLRWWPWCQEAPAELDEAGLVSCLWHQGGQRCEADRWGECGLASFQRMQKPSTFPKEFGRASMKMHSCHRGRWWGGRLPESWSVSTVWVQETWMHF